MTADEEENVLQRQRANGYLSINIDNGSDLEGIEDDSARWKLDGHGFGGGKTYTIWEKLNNRYYCRIRSCSEFRRILSCKCLFATGMLVFCLILAVFFARVMFSETAYKSEPDSFDFIVVGGGPAGSVMARRLTDRGASVLLLEAGSNTQYDLGGSDSFGGPISRFDIPLLWSSLSSFADFSWQGFNIPNVLLAKGLGGCGVQNAMMYVRALASDIESWNVPGWTWDVMMTTYKTLERYTPSDEENSATNIAQADYHSYHGTDGPIPTTRSQYIDEIAPEFVSAAVQSGLKLTRDFNAPEGRVGVGYYHFNIEGGIRASASRAMLGPIINGQKPNFLLQLKAEVTKVLLVELPQIIKNSTATPTSTGSTPTSSSNPSPAIDPLHAHYKAVGVEYTQDGVTKTAYLKSLTLPSMSKMGIDFSKVRSVILTAGALLTPKILMNSGIGPKEVLLKAGVKVRVENENVGQNLQDHPSVGVTALLSPTLAASYPSAYTVARQFSQYIDTVVAYRGYGTHPFSSSTSSTSSTAGDKSGYGLFGSVGLSAGAFLVSPYSETGTPDIQLTVFPQITEPHFIDRRERANAAAAAVSATIVSPSMPSTNNNGDGNNTSRNNNSDSTSDTNLDYIKTNNEFIINQQSQEQSKQQQPSQLQKPSQQQQQRILDAQRSSDDSQMLIAVTLLTPTARMRVVLNGTHPLSAVPTILSVPATDGNDPLIPTTTTSSSLLHAVPSSKTTDSPSSSTSTTTINEKVEYLSEIDVNKLEWGIQQVRKILATPPLLQLLGGETSPGGNIPSGGDELQRWVRENVYPNSHWVGTCSMGGDGGKSSVVDEALKVYGVERLRVADASVIPIIPNGNVHSTVVAIAHHGAELIVAEANAAAAAAAQLLGLK